MSTEVKRLQQQLDIVQERYQKAVAVIKLCKGELQGWNKEYGPDLDTLEVMIEATKVIIAHAKESGK